MHTSSVSVNVEGRSYSFKVGGDTKWGKDRVLLDSDDDLTKNTELEKSGYIVAKFLSTQECADLKSLLKHILCNKLKEILNIELLPDKLTDYHKHVSQEEHLKFVSEIYNKGRGLSCKKYINEFYEKIENRVSELCGVDVTTKMAEREHEEFFIRFVRPYENLLDNNPPHRDAYIPRLKNALNIYFPLCGSNKDSSLGIIPESHRWKENEIERTVSGTEIGEYSFSVSCITDTKHGGINIKRPQPNDGEFVLFSPYCIHGGAPNFADKTRVSLEVRFWRK